MNPTNNDLQTILQTRDGSHSLMVIVSLIGKCIFVLKLPALEDGFLVVVYYLLAKAFGKEDCDQSTALNFKNILFYLKPLLFFISIFILFYCIYLVM